MTQPIRHVSAAIISVIVTVTVLHKLFVVCEYVQIGEVETSGSNEMRLLSGR